MSFWFVVPAAGVGKRFGSNTAKQYLDLAGKKVIEHTLERLLALAPAGIVVAINGEDTCWQTLPISRHPLVHTVTGGRERADSVRLALSSLHNMLSCDDWVLVHDVARPCVTTADIATLISQLAHSDIGGILAAPVSDTLKRCDDQMCIEKTEDRSRLWSALTPQMFRYGILQEALVKCQQLNITPTDEAMAVELLGYHPLLVPGRRDNIKITLPEDMALAETILRWQQRTA